MPRGILNKNDILAKVLKIRVSIDDRTFHPEWSEEQRTSSRQTISKILDSINEYYN